MPPVRQCPKCGSGTMVVITCITNNFNIAKLILYTHIYSIEKKHISNHLII